MNTLLQKDAFKSYLNATFFGNRFFEDGMTLKFPDEIILDLVTNPDKYLCKGKEREIDTQRYTGKAWWRQAEIGVMLPQARELWEPPDTGWRWWGRRTPHWSMEWE